MDLKGTYTAMITPFKNGLIDKEGWIQNIQDQLQSGVNGLVFLGTTAEAPTLTPYETRTLLEIGISEVNKQVPILVGTGTNCTRTTIEKTLEAQKLGADAVLIIAPYYNKPTQRGLFKHFQHIAENTSLPIVLYNHPGRTGVNIELETLLQLANLDSIIGVKDALSNLTDLKKRISSLRLKYPSFSILSGCDELALESVKMGGQGVISVLSNLLPNEMKRLIDQALSGHVDEAQSLQDQLLPLMDLLTIETNPVPIKAAMDFAQKPAGPCRLPLCDLSSDNQQKLHAFLNQWEHLPLCKN